jgi:hypothetical protein
MDIVFISLGYISRSGPAGLYGKSVFNLLRNWQTSSKMVGTMFQCESSSSSTSLLTVITVSLFDSSYHSGLTVFLFAFL